MRLLLWGILIVAALFAVDRVLLWLEARGWLYYRRNKPRRGAATYHLMEIHTTFEPGFEEVMEAKVHEERSEDESGDPADREEREPRQTE